MSQNKIIDDIAIPLDLLETEPTQFCLVVFSSKEEHIAIVIDCIETVIEGKKNYQVKKLDSSLKSGDSQYKRLIGLVNECSFAVVILDGLRPNVLFEYGILKGLGKPCIVLLEKEAKVDVVNYFPEGERDGIANPKIDMDKHVSDVKDRFYIRYNKNLPKLIRSQIKDEFIKLKDDINLEFLRMNFPEKEIIEHDLKDQLIKLNDIHQKKVDNLNRDDELEFEIAIEKIEGILKKHNLILEKHYFFMVANLYMRFGRNEDALNIIDPILKNRKEDIDLLKLKAKTFANMEKYDEAIKIIDKGLKLKPNEESLWHNKGLFFEQDGKMDEGRFCFKQGVQFNKDNGCSSIHYHYGLSLYEIDNFSDALEQFEKALEINPQDDNYLLWKGRALAQLGDKKKAKKIVEEALAFNDKNPDAWYTLGQLSSSDHNESIKHFDKTISLNPHHPGAICSKGSQYSNIGEIDEALKIFNKMNNICPNSESCITLGNNISTTLMKNKKYKKALIYNKKVLKLDENNGNAIGIKAMILYEQGKTEESLKYVKKSLTIDPENANVWYNQACLFAKMNKVNKSIKALKKAIKLNPSFKDEIKTDTDFDLIKDNEKFKKVFK